MRNREDGYLYKDGGRAGISNISNQANTERIALIKAEFFFVPLAFRTCTMKLSGVLTLFLATAAQATVTAEALVNKLNQFKADAWRMQGPARLISPLDAFLLEYKVGGAYVRPLPRRGRSYQTVASLHSTRAH